MSALTAVDYENPATPDLGFGRMNILRTALLQSNDGVPRSASGFPLADFHFTLQQRGFANA